MSDSVYASAGMKPREGARRMEPAASGPASIGRPLRLLIILMFVNLGISIIATVLIAVFHKSLFDYELAHSNLSASIDPQQLAMVRKALADTVWTRIASTVLVSALYVWRAYALRRNSRRAYRRLILICVTGLFGIGFLMADSRYPTWMHVEQALQGLVLVAMLIVATRRDVRSRFARSAVSDHAGAAWASEPRDVAPVGRRRR